MKIEDVVANAFAMPLTNPTYPPGPYRFTNREFLTLTYRTTMEALRAVVPEPLEVTEPLVKFEFIRMPDSTGFGDYTESGQVIPVTYKGQKGGYVHAMYLNDDAPIAGGREIWGFPKKLAEPALRIEKDTLVGTLDVGSVRVATGTMGYKHRALDADTVLAALAEPNFMVKIIPHVDCTPRICELVRYYLTDVTLKGAWSGPAGLQLFDHALAPVSRPAGAGGGLGGASGRRSDPRSGRGRARLSGLSGQPPWQVDAHVSVSLHAGASKLPRRWLASSASRAIMPFGGPGMFEGMSVSHLLVVGLLVLVMFGRGKVSSLMGEVGKGITAFKRGVQEGGRDVEAAATPAVTAEVEKI